MNCAFCGISGEPPARVKASASGVKNTPSSSIDAPPLMRKRVEAASAHRASAVNGPSRGAVHLGGAPPEIWMSPLFMTIAVRFATREPPVIFTLPPRKSTTAAFRDDVVRQPVTTVRQVDGRLAVTLAVLNWTDPPFSVMSPSKMMLPPVKFSTEELSLRSLQSFPQLPGTA